MALPRTRAMAHWRTSKSRVPSSRRIPPDALLRPVGPSDPESWMWTRSMRTAVEALTSSG